MKEDANKVMSSSEPERRGEEKIVRPRRKTDLWSAKRAIKKRGKSVIEG